MSFRVTYESSKPGEPDVPLYTDVRCSRTACGKQLPPQSTTSPRWLQYDNNLIMVLHGAYGMFTDPMDDLPGSAQHALNPETTLLLCHECAHAFFAWMGIDVSNWHTHVPPELGGTQHDDHHH